MKRLLITGATGLLGRSLCSVAGGKYELLGLARSFDACSPECTPIPLDLTLPEDTLRHLQGVLPRVIIHCAAMTDVDSCETASAKVRKLHVGASQMLAEWASAHGSHFTYISTDSVFDGLTGNYREEDFPMPRNEYGRTKLAGEAAVRSINPGALIIRTNFYGLEGRGRSLAEWILRKLEAGEDVPAFADVCFNPLPARFLAGLILDLIERQAAGTFHIAARDSCSKYEFAKQFTNAFGFDTNTVIPISVEGCRFKAPRPKNTSLDVGKVSSFLGRGMPEIREGLIEMYELFRRSRGKVPVEIPVCSEEPSFCD